MSYARKHAIPASIFLTELDKLPVDDISGGLNMVFAAVDVMRYAWFAPRTIAS